MPHRHFFSTILLLAFFTSGIAQAAKNKAPAAPTNLKVTALGVNAFKLKWKDNSNNELGWDVSVSLKGGKPQHYLYIPTKDITSYTVMTNDLPGFGLVFQIAAYNGPAGAEVVSAPSEIVAVKAQSPNKFEAPSGLTAAPVDDGRVRLQWEDNATSESGYQIQLKGPTDKKWGILGTVGPELKFNIVASGLEPGKKYLFRVRGFKGTTLISEFSNTADVTTMSLRAPDKLEAIAEAEGSFKFKWKDRSSAETGFELQQKVSDGEFTSLGTVGANTDSTELIKDFTLDSEIAFRVRSVRDVEVKTKVDGVEKVEIVKIYSKFSKVLETRSTPLNKPAGPAVTARTDTSITVAWTDKSVRETDYQIDYRKKGATEFTTEYATADATTFTISGLDASTEYEIKIRAVLYNFFSTPPESYSGYTALFEGKTRHGVMPVESSPLVADGQFTYQIQVTDLATLTDLAVTGLPDGLSFNEGTRTISGSLNRETGFSFTVTATFSDGSTSTRVINVPDSTLPAKPTGLAATSSTDTTITLSWADNSVLESGYQIEYREVGTPTFAVISTSANSNTSTVSGLAPGVLYEFQVSAIGNQSGTFSLSTALISQRTRDAVIGDLDPDILLGVPFSYQIELSGTNQLTAVTVTGLPANLVYDSATRKITGTVAIDGRYSAEIKATFSDGFFSTRTLRLWTTTPPVIAAPFESRNVAVGASAVVPLIGKFSDPDTTSAGRIVTTVGQFDIIFFPNAAPLTVDNFIDYMDAEAFDDTFFHRAPANFVVQGGGFKHTVVDGFSRVVKFPSVLNEPGISNRRGTVAMAKVGGQPNSATSEWFVNFKDNSGPPPALDTQNGGFTVFGRVPTSGMAVVDAIMNLPVNDYSISIGAESVGLEDVPINDATAPALLDPAKLVRILSTDQAPILSYTVTSQNTGIATATVAGTDITITGVAAGSTNIDVKATDLDGNFVTQSIPVTVP